VRALASFAYGPLEIRSTVSPCLDVDLSDDVSIDECVTIFRNVSEKQR